MPNPTIQLARQVSTYADGNRLRYRLRYTASGGANDPLLEDNKIFLYRALPGESERVGICQGVCSPSDLADFPADDPGDDDEPPFARAAVFDQLYRSTAAFEFAKQTVEKQVQVLLEALLRLQQLEGSATNTYTATGGA